MLGVGSVVDRLVGDFWLIIDLLRMLSTVRDYVHDELVRCDDVGCVAGVLYRVGRRYLSDNGFKSIYRKVAQVYGEDVVRAVFGKVVGADEAESIGAEVWRDTYCRYSNEYFKQVRELIRWLEGLGSKEFRDVLTMLALLSFTPGYLRLPKKEREGEGSSS